MEADASRKFSSLRIRDSRDGARRICRGKNTEDDGLKDIWNTALYREFKVNNSFLISIYCSNSIILKFELWTYPSFHLLVTRLRNYVEKAEGDGRWLKISARLFVLEQKLPLAKRYHTRGCKPTCKTFRWYFPRGSFQPRLIIMSIAYTGRRGNEERKKGKPKENTRAWQKRGMVREEEKRSQGFKDTVGSTGCETFSLAKNVAVRFR